MAGEHVRHKRRKSHSMSTAGGQESLARYEEMRDFTRTPEPPPGATRRPGPLTFTIQKHAARRLHYDLRLEIDGVLVSWPIPQGPSCNPTVRRLSDADHPYAYGTFEGIIPPGEYGRGEAIVWDAGTYAVVEQDDALAPTFAIASEPSARCDIASATDTCACSSTVVFFNGRKLKGGWTLHRTRGEGTRSQWLFIKRRDGLENVRHHATLEDRSVFSGLRIEDLKGGQRPPPNPHAALRPTADGVPGARRAKFPRPYDPMLPTLTREVFERNDWLYEPKLDGYRMLAFVRHGQLHLRSRGGQPYEDRYAELVKALSIQPMDDAVIDGEVVALGPDGALLFKCLQNRSGTATPRSASAD
jgi:bifunctional non-homologous end joining protein LigD